MSRINRAVCLVALVCFVMCGGVAEAGIQNGDFSSTPGVPPNTFAEWETELSLGDVPTDGGGFAEFSVEGFAVFSDKQLQQLFSLPSNATTISFEYDLSTSGTRTGAPPDSFQASLWDEFFTETFFPSAPFPFSAFFSVDNDGTEFFDPTFVSVASIPSSTARRVTLNVSSQPPDDYHVEFYALGSDDGLDTTFALDNVIKATQSNVIPEPSSLLVWGGLGLVGMLVTYRRRSMRPLWAK